MLNEPFKEFIPDFRYYLISLNKFSRNELISRKSSQAFVMLINSIQNAEEFKKLGLTKEYVDSMIVDSPQSVLEAIAKVIAVVLRKQNIPEDDIQDMVDNVKRRKSMALFDNWKGFDYRAVMKEGEEKGETIMVIRQVCKKMSMGHSIEKIAEDLIVRAFYSYLFLSADNYHLADVYYQVKLPPGQF